MHNRIAGGGQIDFTEWIEVFHTQNATKPRDKLYRLYRLADQEKYGYLPIGYKTRTNKDVFTLATQEIVRASQKLDVVCLRRGNGRALTLPSWVPDFRITTGYMYSYWPLNYMSVPAFAASGRPAQCAWSYNKQIVYVVGVEINRIAIVEAVDKFQEDVREGVYSPHIAGEFLHYAREITANINRLEPPWDALTKTLVRNMNKVGLRLAKRQGYMAMPIVTLASPHFRSDGHDSHTDASAKEEYLAF